MSVPPPDVREHSPIAGERIGDEPSLFDPAPFEAALQQSLKVSRPRSSLDEARAFSGWTIHKLELLRMYLKQYRRVAGNGSYIDGFAGEGRIVVDGEVRSGSAAVALGSGAFKTLRFYERPQMAAKLTRWVDEASTPAKTKRCTVVAGDFNRTVLPDLASGCIPREKPCFALLDPNGTELSWSSVVALASYKAECDPPRTCKIEMWILLNTYQVLMRLLPHHRKPNSSVLNRWLGGEEGWLDLYEAGAGPGQYAYRYSQRLMTELGYGLAIPLLIRDPKTSRPQYHMIHASDHRAAHEFMRWAANHAGTDDAMAQSLPGM